MMKHVLALFPRILLLAAACALAACETNPPAPPQPEPAVQPVAPPPVAEPARPVLDPVAQKEKALTDAISAYNEGRYEDAIGALTPLSTAPELPMGSQVRAYKYLAFSYCAGGNVRGCRTAFDGALALDPTFQLTEAERGHPVWGREFTRARASAMTKRRNPAPAAR